MWNQAVALRRCELNQLPGIPETILESEAAMGCEDSEVRGWPFPKGACPVYTRPADTVTRNQFGVGGRLGMGLSSGCNGSVKSLAARWVRARLAVVRAGPAYVRRELNGVRIAEHGE